MKSILYFFIPMLILSSCGTLKVSDSKTITIDNNVIQYPTVADLEVDSKSVSGTIEWKDKCFSRGISLEVRKGNLIAELTSQAKADLLVEPRFIIEKGNSGLRSRKLTVTGFPAHYKNFRPANKEDIEAIFRLSPFTTQVKTYNAKAIQRGDVKNIKTLFQK